MHLSRKNTARHRLARLILGLAVTTSAAVATGGASPTHAAGAIASGALIHTCPGSICRLVPPPTITVYMNGVLTVNGQNFTPGGTVHMSVYDDNHQVPEQIISTYLTATANVPCFPHHACVLSAPAGVFTYTTTIPYGSCYHELTVYAYDEQLATYSNAVNTPGNCDFVVR
jgi:hypothetical protein